MKGNRGHKSFGWVPQAFREHPKRPPACPRGPAAQEPGGVDKGPQRGSWLTNTAQGKAHARDLCPLLLPQHTREGPEPGAGALLLISARFHPGREHGSAHTSSCAPPTPQHPLPGGGQCPLQPPAAPSAQPGPALPGSSWSSPTGSQIPAFFPDVLSGSALLPTHGVRTARCPPRGGETSPSQTPALPPTFQHLILVPR